MKTRVRLALRILGEDIGTARRKRRLRQVDLAAAMGVSVGVLQRLERGSPGVTLGSLAAALVALGTIDRIESLMDMAEDDIGLLEERKRLPRRIRRHRVDPLTGRKLDPIEGAEY